MKTGLNLIYGLITEVV